MLLRQSEAAVLGDGARLAAKSLCAVTLPIDFVSFAPGNFVLVAVVNQHFFSLRRLCEDKLLLAKLSTADNFLNHFRFAAICEEDKKEF